MEKKVYYEAYHGIKSIGLANLVTNEIITEIAACRTTYPRTERDNRKFRQETNGYEGITFSSNLLAAAFGIEEREILRGGLQNEEKFNNALMKNISSVPQKDYFCLMFSCLECKLDMLYNALCENEDNSMSKQMIASNLEGIIHDIYNIVSLRVLWDTREIDKEYAEKLAYDAQKIEIILEDSIFKFGYMEHNNINIEMIKRLLVEIKSEKLELVKVISDIIALAENKDKITDEHEWQEAVKAAKYGEYINTFGMEEEKSSENRFRLVEEYPKTNHEFDDAVQWDNESVTEIMKQLWNEKEVVDVGKLEQEIEFQTVLQNLKNFITKFQNRNQKKLNAPDENGEGGFVEPKSDFDERCKVPPEKLQPLKPSTKPKKIEKENGKE